MFPDSPRALLGAAAIVAALMGALVVLAPGARIRFRWWMPFYLRSGGHEGSFAVPLWATVLFYYSGDVLFAVMASPREVRRWHVLAGLAVGLGTGTIARLTGVGRADGDVDEVPSDESAAPGGGSLYARQLAARQAAYGEPAVESSSPTDLGERSEPRPNELEEALARGDGAQALAEWRVIERDQPPVPPSFRPTRFDSRRCLKGPA